jgi:hypothetical protein
MLLYITPRFPHPLLSAVWSNLCIHGDVYHFEIKQMNEFFCEHLVVGLDHQSRPGDCRNEATYVIECHSIMQIVQTDLPPSRNRVRWGKLAIVQSHLGGQQNGMAFELVGGSNEAGRMVGYRMYVCLYLSWLSVFLYRKLTLMHPLFQRTSLIFSCFMTFHSPCGCCTSTSSSSLSCDPINQLAHMSA